MSFEGHLCCGIRSIRDGVLDGGPRVRVNNKFAAEKGGRTVARVGGSRSARLSLHLHNNALVYAVGPVRERNRNRTER